MAKPTSLPLQERITRKNTLQKAAELIIFFFLLSLLAYRLVSLNDHGFTWLLALVCESWFTFIWILTINAKWNQTEHKTYPERLLDRIDELPPVDLFVTTADPILEPPIITVNTVLSLLSLDYPSNKLACYVSDDGGSPVTYYSLVEASKFAKLWVPFCKKYKVPVRAPFQYFSGDKPGITDEYSLDFQQEWRKLKNEYELLSQRIEDAVQNTVPFDLTPDFAAFRNIERKNHSSIVKVIWENKEQNADGVPHLVYVSREKRPKYPHNFKAGAMNVLTRVSGVMTNSPFMLNVDCDMFANNPQIVLHAMCLLLGMENERESGYVQSPQGFYGGLKDDPYGNQMVILQEYLGRGFAGIQGPLYGGTGCFHRRKAIYGLSPEEAETGQGTTTSSPNVNGKLREEENLKSRFGCLAKFVKSAAQLLSGTHKNVVCPNDISSLVNEASQVADCSYESNTDWGSKSNFLVMYRIDHLNLEPNLFGQLGWLYGSCTEDILTGLRIQSKGWGSVYCTPDPPAFLGCAPSSGPACMIQMKRWSTGLLEILFNDLSPINCTIRGNLRFRQCLVYLYINLWAIRSIPELIYAALPAYCLLSNTSFLPKVTEPAIFMPASIFILYHLYTLSEFMKSRLSIRNWWNNKRMGRIISATAWLFGIMSVILKLLGISETVFEITKKDQSIPNDGDDKDGNSGRFTFDDTPVFIPATTLVLVHLTAIVVSLFRFWVQPMAHYHGGELTGSGLGEFIGSLWVVLSFLPFVKGLFRKGIYGIPTSTICKSATLTAIFVHVCGWGSKV